ncbi:hypothetical protein VTG60DRAFT_4504 [Thermothelomyces hinnuleus]
MVVPVAVARQPDNHGVDHGRPSQGGTAGIVDAEELGALGRAALAHPVTAVRGEPGQVAVLVVSRIPLGIVLDVEVPGHGRRVHPEPSAGAVISRLEEQDRVSGLGEIGSHNAAARSAPDDNIVVDRSIGWWTLCRGRRAVEQKRQGKERAQGTSPVGLAQELHLGKSSLFIAPGGLTGTVPFRQRLMGSRQDQGWRLPLYLRMVGCSSCLCAAAPSALPFSLRQRAATL